jgi:hypothetical protein
MLQRQVMDTSNRRGEGGAGGLFGRRGRRPLTEDIVVLGDRAAYAEFMPHWLSIGWFVAIVAAVAVIVWWEFKRVRDTPYLAPGVVKRYLAAESTSPRRLRVRKEIKRSCDAWD